MLVEYNPLLPEHQLDPYPTYDRLRTHDPVHFSEIFRAWVVSRHADVSALLRDPRFGSDRHNSDLIHASPLPPVREDLQPLADALKRNLLFSDPPDHTRVRALVAKAFTPAKVDGHRGRIQSLVDEAFARADVDGGFDFVRDLADPMPVMVVAELLGLPPSQHRQFKVWSEEIGALLDPFVPHAAIDPAQASARDMFRFFQEVFADRRRRPRDDLIGTLVDAESRGEIRDELELFATCALLLGAGHQTTTNLLGNAVHALLQYPDQRARLATHPDLMATAIEEFLRYESPVQVTARIANADYSLHGKTMARGDFVIVLLGSANRDPAEFVDADRLDVGRRINRHLAFSTGVHACVGALLARLEAETTISTLLRRFPRVSPASEWSDWKPMVISRGLNSLPLRLHGAPR